MNLHSCIMIMSKYIVYIRGHSWYWMCACLDQCMMACTHHYSIIQCFSCSVCSTPFQSPANSDFPTAFQGLLSSCITVGFPEHWSFPDSFSSLSNIHLGLFRDSSQLINLFYFRLELVYISTHFPNFSFVLFLCYLFSLISCSLGLFICDLLSMCLFSCFDVLFNIYLDFGDYVYASSYCFLI